MSVSVGFCFAAVSFIQSCLADTPKASKSSSATKEFTMIKWANLGVVDYLRSGALLLAFLAILVSDKRGKATLRGKVRNMWVNAEVVSFFVCGLACFFFPSQFLQYITKTSLNETHMLHIQATGAILVGAAITTGRQQPSLENDPVVHASWLTSRLVASGSIFVFLLRAHIRMDIFTDQNASFVLLAVFLWFVGCVWQYLTTDKIGGVAGVRGTSSCINFYLLADLLINFVAALNHLGNPAATFDWFINLKPDEFNLHLLQTTVLLLLTLSLPTLSAIFYANEEDKRHIFAGRLVTFALHLPCLGLHLWKNLTMTRNGLIMMACVLTLQTGIFLRGYFIKEGKAKSR